ncbi:hypothetical protein [Segatella maculosa]|uniref:hypothetical protein n=1 Tax=Segatella maculosa TaxID=439703 RepID=UPI0028D63D48|nr:hypothetical protein [Segatella maculosa]
MMKRYIHIKKEDREFIMKAFKITEKSLLNAISFDETRGNSDTAKRVRRLAMERGGIIMREVPELETLFDADGYIRQYLPGDVLIELSKTDSSCVVFKKGVRVNSYKDVMLSDIPGIQAYAAGLK